jgi:ATP-binding cassette subfamily D (ALD) protein 3
MEYLLYDFGSKFGAKAKDLWAKHGQTLRAAWATKRGRVAIILVGSSVLGTIRAYNKSKQRAEERNRASQRGLDQKRAKPSVDKKFAARLFSLIKIVMPSIKSIEFMQLCFLTACLLLRTILSIKVAEVIGGTASGLVQQNFQKFIRGVINLGLVAIPASVVNSLLKYFTSTLAIRFRKRLSYQLHSRYMDALTFYKSMSSDSIDNIDQRITQDVEKFSTAVSELYSSTFKPIVDIVLFTRRLVNSIGYGGPILMYFYYVLSGFVMRKLLPNFAKMTVKSQKLEGDFRFNHSRLLMHAEEIAFYRGWGIEKNLVNKSFDALYKHSNSLFFMQAIVGIFDSWLVKYGATMIGYAVLAMGILSSKFNPNQDGSKEDTSDETAAITGIYIRNSQILVNLAQATGQVVLLYKRITALAGYTTRVAELLELLKALQRDHDGFLTKNFKGETSSRTQQLVKNTGNYVESADYISFDHVNIESPDEELMLVKDLSFEIKPGMNLLITGPNGSGKSSIFRVLNRLWPLRSGTITKPSIRDLMFVPQRPYFPLGTLRDQIIYPDTLEDMKSKNVTDADLLKIMEEVDLAYLCTREGWEAVKEWVDILSGGEKQRLSMARIYYKKPKFAILDECTSAVSTDIEEHLYRRCQEIGTTLITVSHRMQLMKYHQYFLKLEDHGAWNFTKIEHNQ